MSYQSALEKYRYQLWQMASVDLSHAIQSGTLVWPNDSEEFLRGHEKFQRQVWIWIGIIDSMRDDERSLVHKESRCNRVASGSGASCEQVVEFISNFISYAELLEQEKNTPVWTPRFPFSSEVCEKTHSSMISGVCPWCGRAIINEQLQ
jgi:hypothetical protein